MVIDTLQVFPIHKRLDWRIHKICIQNTHCYHSQSVPAYLAIAKKKKKKEKS